MPYIRSGGSVVGHWLHTPLATTIEEFLRGAFLRAPFYGEERWLYNKEAAWRTCIPMQPYISFMSDRYFRR